MADSHGKTMGKSRLMAGVRTACIAFACPSMVLAQSQGVTPSPAPVPAGTAAATGVDPSTNAAVNGAPSSSTSVGPSGDANGAAQPKGSAPVTGAEASASEIVVTGTLIRGIAPVGTQVVAVSQQDIIKTGVASTNNLLASVPLVSTFNTVAAVPTNIGNASVRPNIRGLTIDQYAPSTTLLLLDGHNIVGAGILQTTPDPSLIPPGALERVEVVPDGGSSLYGSDAVSGIINFITRKKFDGTEIAMHGGTASPYRSADLSVTTGASWQGGSAVFSFFSRQNTALIAGDRKFPRRDLTPFGGSDSRVRTCNPATVTVGSTPYALASGTPVFTGLTAGSFNLCDPSRVGSIVPKEHQNSAFASVSQEISPAIHLEVTGFFSDRESKQVNPQIQVAGAVINASNPFFRQINGGSAASQTVAFSYAAVAGPTNISSSHIRAWEIDPQVTIDLGNDWQVKARFGYGDSRTETHQPTRNAPYEASVLRQAAGSGVILNTNTALNPYDVTQTNRDVIRTILNWENYAISRQTLTQGRVETSGSLFTLPGGDVRIALGAQFSHEFYKSFSANGPRYDRTGAPNKAEGRDVYAAFGELYVPVVGADNEMPLIHRLSLDFSGRYDKYENCCNTTNPKIGVTYEPFDGLSIRGNWGTSFNAPSLADTGDAVDTRVSVGLTTAVTALAPGANAAVDSLRPSLSVPGGNATLQPQTATTWSIGADLTPRQVPGLNLGVTYWNVELRRSIGTSTFPTNELYTTPAYSKYYILYPTLQQALAAFGGTANLPVDGAASVASLYGIGNDPYVIRDLRRNNLGNQYVGGLDFKAGYRHDTSFGAVRGSVFATYLLTRKSQPFDGGPKVNTLLANNRKLSLSTSLSADIGNLTATATMNYSGGYDVTGVINQTEVKSFHPVNLFVRYAFDNSSGFLKDLELTLNVDNVFNIYAPFFNNTTGYTNGSTIGRYFNVGIRKRFR